MSRALIPILVFSVSLAAGCMQEAPPPPPEYLVDPADDAPARYDLLRANFTELNGSLVLWIEVKNYREGLPLLEARMHASPGEAYARIRADTTKPSPPQVAVEVGRMNGEAFGPGEETCMIPSQPADPSGGPWYLLIDLLHNMTGFAGGATVRDLRLRTLDVDGGLQDEGSRSSPFRVEGHTNPYEGSSVWCPLANEGRHLA